MTEPVPRHRVWVGGPVLPGADAWTLGRLVVARRGAYARTSWDRLLEHELVHVRQQAELGLPRFLALYLLDYVRGRRAGLGHEAAYRAVRFEQEAYAPRDSRG